MFYQYVLGTQQIVKKEHGEKAIEQYATTIAEIEKAPGPSLRGSRLTFRYKVRMTTIGR
jgi:hypothetical protein